MAHGHGGALRRAVLLAVVALAGTLACSGGDDSDDGTAGGGNGGGGEDGSRDSGGPALPDGWDGYESETYADPANWLCLPGGDTDACTAEDLDATAVDAAGELSPAPHEPAEDPPVDCFYVYPTTSQDEGISADLEPAENQEVWVIRNQAARLTGACRVFAPVYRQRTVSGIGVQDEGEQERAFELAYGDVFDAFRHYVANLSEGRGFVLVGHSQGAGLLRDLVEREIDGEPALRSRLVSAMLLGTTVPVPEGDVVGGVFDEVPLCEAPDQVGCAISYATFRSDQPPPPTSLFGRTADPDTPAACTNPAALGGGAAMLTPYFPTAIPEGALSGEVAAGTMSRLARLDTPWVTMPDWVSAECVRAPDGASYLAVTIGGAADDVRGTDVGGSLGPDWGLHLVDVNIAMGDLVELVRSQGEAYGEG